MMKGMNSTSPSIYEEGWEIQREIEREGKRLRVCLTCPRIWLPNPEHHMLYLSGDDSRLHYCIGLICLLLAGWRALWHERTQTPTHTCLIWHPRGKTPTRRGGGGRHPGFWYQLDFPLVFEVSGDLQLRQGLNSNKDRDLILYTLD